MQGCLRLFCQRATNPTVEVFVGGTCTVTASAAPNRLHYCIIFIAYTEFTNVSGGLHKETWRATSWTTAF